MIDEEGEDIKEKLVGERIDVGEVEEEFFDMEIDKYKRKKGKKEEREKKILGDGDGDEKKV